MITAERLAEIAIDGRDAMPMKAELLELVNAYRVDYSDLQRQLSEAKAEIEAMRLFIVEQDLVDVFEEYESRKQP